MYNCFQITVLFTWTEEEEINKWINKEDTILHLFIICLFILNFFLSQFKRQVVNLIPTKIQFLIAINDKASITNELLVDAALSGALSGSIGTEHAYQFQRLSFASNITSNTRIKMKARIYINVVCMVSRNQQVGKLLKVNECQAGCLKAKCNHCSQRSLVKHNVVQDTLYSQRFRGLPVITICACWTSDSRFSPLIAVKVISIVHWRSSFRNKSFSVVTL